MLEKRNIGILKILVKTNYKLRYQDSLIGHLWLILKPLCLFSIMYFFFAVILKLGQNTPHFPIAMLVAFCSFKKLQVLFFFDSFKRRLIK